MSEWGIGGIQQLGLGVCDLEAEWQWYRRRLGFDIPVFRDRGEARLMTRYTGGAVERREAIMALNLQGGGGLEIWMFTSRKPEMPSQPPTLGDVGILAGRLSSADIERAFLSLAEYTLSTAIMRDPSGIRHFFICGPNGALLQVVETDDVYIRSRALTTGIRGAIIGLSDIDRSLPFYRDLLGYRRTIYDVETDANGDDLSAIMQRPSSDADAAGRRNTDALAPQPRFRRVALEREPPIGGAFGKVLGGGRLELVQSLDGRPHRRLYDGRFWGDPGFIHLCFDVFGMDALSDHCRSHGAPFTVDSGDFQMGDSAGRFAYIEDPDGTLIELVETHRVPIHKRLGLFIDLRRRGSRPLPKSLIRLFALKRVR